MIVKFKKLSKSKQDEFTNLYVDYLEEILKKKVKKKKIKFDYILKKADFYILIYYNSVACFCSIYKNLSKKNIYVRDLYTIPKYRKKGLSKKMFYNIILIAKKIKANSIHINILKSNKKIISYWNNLSFKKKLNNYELKLNDSY
tara:strand:+ start:2217 stop:2648 length:432 start_codon:yes stop_codon:yes gene_type:complete